MIDGWVVWTAAAAAVALAVVWRGRKRDVPAPRLAARVVLVAYLAWMITETLFPLPVGASAPHEAASWRASVNLVPLRTIRDTAGLGWCWPTVRQLAGNVLVFVPFGVLVPTVWRRLATWPRMAAAGLAFSLAIELAQLIVSLGIGYGYRSTDVDDMLLNVLGVLLGFVCWKLPHDRRRTREVIDV